MPVGWSDFENQESESSRYHIAGRQSRYSRYPIRTAPTEIDLAIIRRHASNRSGLQHNANEHATMNRNARMGIIFFCVYAAIYLAFVLGNAFAPKMMERTPIAGINLAVLGGLGLITVAFVLSLAYGWLCSKSTSSDQSTDQGERS